MTRALFLLAGLLCTMLPVPASPAPIETFRIWVDLEIDETGQVTDANPASQLDDALQAVVVDAAKQWIFTPTADYNGVPAPSTSSTWLELSLVEGEGGMLDLQINRLYEGPRPETHPVPVLPENIKKVQLLLPVQFVVEKNGKPRDITLLESGPEDAYDRAAIDAIRATQFIPRTAVGEPIAVWVVFPIEFQGPGLESALSEEP